jgi:hypothetical protein
MNSYVAAVGRAGAVNNAMFTGKKGRVSSRRGIKIAPFPIPTR